MNEESLNKLRKVPAVLHASFIAEYKTLATSVDYFRYWREFFIQESIYNPGEPEWMLYEFKNYD
jgi:hypothetical protein